MAQIIIIIIIFFFFFSSKLIWPILADLVVKVRRHITNVVVSPHAATIISVSGFLSIGFRGFVVSADLAAPSVVAAGFAAADVDNQQDSKQNQDNGDQSNQRDHGPRVYIRTVVVVVVAAAVTAAAAAVVVVVAR